MKINVFLSVAGPEGIIEGEKLREELQSFIGPSGIKFQCHIYTDKRSVGSPVSESNIEIIKKSNFFVPILTSSYAEMYSHQYAKEELSVAVELEKRLIKSSKGRFRFVFPFANQNGNELIEQIGLLTGKVFASNVKDLADEMIRNSPFAILKEESFGFSTDWPNTFFDERGNPNLLMVLGHSGKEDTPTPEDLQKLKICSIEEDLIRRFDDAVLDHTKPSMPTQSMRICEFIPKLVQFLSNSYLERNPKNETVPEFNTDIDFHLLKYRQHLLEENNLICFGAGDTNWISRAVLAFYGSLLPVTFDTAHGSQTIHYQVNHAQPSGDENIDTSGKLVIERELRHIGQVPTGKGLFAAILLILPNPWNFNKRVIIAAGLTALGSQAAILALCKSEKLLNSTNSQVPWARVIRGVEGKEKLAFKAIDFEVVG